ncbi:MAG: hypothetical protein ACFB14_20400 [Leptolyngbyaceae cyanobacterium]
MIAKIIHWLRDDSQTKDAFSNIQRKVNSQRRYNPEVRKLTPQERLKAISKTHLQSNQQKH